MEGNRTAAIKLLMSKQYNDTVAVVTESIENLQAHVCTQDTLVLKKNVE
jgi:hypothetical protein